MQQVCRHAHAVYDLTSPTRPSHMNWPLTTFLFFPRNRNAHYPPHKHGDLTTHSILSGEFTVTYPEENPSKKETFGTGVRIDVPAGKVHEV